jgi:putative transcriptional regulator
MQAMATSEAPINLTNQFLIAMPGMADPTFSGSVVYLCEHNERGALGLVINRPIDIDMATLFDKIDLKLEIQPVAHQPVYFGGPVQTERGFVLHDPVGIYVSSGGARRAGNDHLQGRARSRGQRQRPAPVPAHARLRGWGAGQLEDELSRNGWLTVQADPEIIFSVPPEERFAAAIRLLGIDISMLSGDAGHA